MEAVRRLWRGSAGGVEVAVIRRGDGNEDEQEVTWKLAGNGSGRRGEVVKDGGEIDQGIETDMVLG